MNSNQRDLDILEHILKYCNEIVKTQKYFGNSFEKFQTNSIYVNAIAMCLLQIGELSGYLSDDFKHTYDGVPWKNIKGMRNIMAHKYGDLSISTVWEAVEDDIPALKNYCKQIIKNIRID